MCLSTQKMYGTWGDPEPLQEELIADEEWRAGTHLSVQEIAGQRVLRFSGRPPNPAAPRSLPQLPLGGAPPPRSPARPGALRWSPARGARRRTVPRRPRRAAADRSAGWRPMCSRRS
ncbi:hypothetical protein [Streptomyces lonegramiae]|uniref:Uncharacterized protein n=1 Tax=Streptomyces lonegramiae TaxID=3075524 RepID=A0ABU2XDN0_9ACTN|nr:hypothetical protein [Streptomyces sp. DSM 41529]MDT0543235.1 hypothetical protein [Streptomyces sp. DSM 41529]